MDKSRNKHFDLNANHMLNCNFDLVYIYIAAKKVQLIEEILIGNEFPG